MSEQKPKVPAAIPLKELLIGTNTETPVVVAKALVVAALLASTIGFAIESPAHSTVRPAHSSTK